MMLLGFLIAGGAVVHAVTRLASLEGPRSWIDRVNVLAGDGFLLILAWPSSSWATGSAGGWPASSATS